MGVERLGGSAPRELEWFACVGERREGRPPPPPLRDVERRSIGAGVEVAVEGRARPKKRGEEGERERVTESGEVEILPPPRVGVAEGASVGSGLAVVEGRFGTSIPVGEKVVVIVGSPVCGETTGEEGPSEGLRSAVFVVATVSFVENVPGRLALEFALRVEDDNAPEWGAVPDVEVNQSSSSRDGPSEIADK